MFPNATTCDLYASPQLCFHVLFTFVLTVDLASENRWCKHNDAADALERRRLRAEEAASAAQAVMGPEKDKDVEDVDMNEEDAPPTPTTYKELKKSISKEAKENRFLYKTFPKIVSTAFSAGFEDNYKDPDQPKFFPLWDPEVIASLRAALDFAHSVPKNAARLQKYVLNIFEAAVQVKKENPDMFPVGQLVLPADQEAFLHLVGQTMSKEINAGSLKRVNRDLSAFCLGQIIDGVAKARRAYLDNSVPGAPEGTVKELRVLEVVDQWIGSFSTGSTFLLQDLVLKSRGLITATLRPAQE
ncbi:hypothetical protein F5X68DRAFT_229214 [Plectosphaerella plurivora]|uniref:Uncharacterized protein n=1 Tax=Plectosphaerella plurivora TaxID=936078 RepID=A0A9P8VIA4_9PEZI|nr:hypothetical protein F5X68DRAFT_229214 [Plectosphaerella plurivora]